jgi:hypothetical protein
MNDHRQREEEILRECERLVEKGEAHWVDEQPGRWWECPCGTEPPKRPSGATPVRTIVSLIAACLPLLRPPLPAGVRTPGRGRGAVSDSQKRIRFCEHSAEQRLQALEAAVWGEPWDDHTSIDVGVVEDDDRLVDWNDDAGDDRQEGARP